MAFLSTQDFTGLVRNMAATVQANSTKLINLTVGSVLRSIIEANAGLLLWLQGLVAYVLTLTRAMTSVGADLDSWMADYALTRLPANNSSGIVTFARFTTTAQAIVPLGALVQTNDGTQGFIVTLDVSNGAYSAGLGGYVLSIGVTSVSVPVLALNAGAQGNVLAGSITSIGQSISGVDTVTNASAFTNGIDAESDVAFRARFPAYLASLSKATKAAIGFAITNVQQGLQYTITENQDYDGTANMGFFYVVADDGSGVPSSGLLNAIGTAIDRVRPLTSRYAVFAPVLVTADVTLVLTTASGFVHNDVIAAVTVAVRAFINALPLGATLPYTQLAAIAYGVSGVTNVSGILLNGATADVTANAKTVIKAGTMVFS